MNTTIITLTKTIATLALIACCATAFERHWDSTAPPPVAVPEPISPAAVEDWTVVA